MQIINLDANEFGLRFLDMGERSLTAVLGYAVVFAGLLALMVIVILMGLGFKAKAKRSAAAIETPAAPVPVPAVEAKPAPGSAGEVKRFDVPDREAAMIMAIVADQMGKPLNELRFLSIKEVKNDEV